MPDFIPNNRLTEGQVIGAVAAGGAMIEQDVLIAQAALAALDSSLEIP
jgi:uncharacterized protein GlcG (DUF336 family)